MYRWLQRLFTAPAQADREDTPLPPAPAAPPATPALAPLIRPAVSFDQLDQANGRYYRWLFDTDGEPGLDTNPLEDQALDALGAIINSQQSGSAMVRRMPGMIPQLLQSLRSDNFSGAQLSRTISNDVVLVAAVIRLATARWPAPAPRSTASSTRSC